MRPVQHFSEEYLDYCKKLSPTERAKFVEEYRELMLRSQTPTKQHNQSKLISLRVPEPLLKAFKSRCEVMGASYQKKIKELMLEWLK